MPTKRQGASAPVVLPAHLSLLRDFGRNEYQRGLNEAQREKFWAETCRQGRVPPVPLSVVTEAWRRFVTAQSRHSGLAVNAEVDTKYVSVGVTYHRRIQAAHTTPLRSLLKRLLTLHRKCFSDEELFLLDVLALCGPEQSAASSQQPDDKPREG